MSAEVENVVGSFGNDVVEDGVITVAENFVEDGLVSGGFEVELESFVLKFYFGHMCCIVGGDEENSNYWRRGGRNDGGGDFGGKGRL